MVQATGIEANIFKILLLKWKQYYLSLQTLHSLILDNV